MFVTPRARRRDRAATNRHRSGTDSAASARHLLRGEATRRYAARRARPRVAASAWTFAAMMLRLACWTLAVAGAPLVAQAAAPAPAALPPAPKATDATSAAPLPAIARDVRALAGWRVLVDARLLATEAVATEGALVLLERMLAEVVRVVPAPAVTALREVPLYVSPACPGHRSGAEYHPSAAWLRDNGRDPAMARCVEFSGVADFEQEMQRMPNFALHELAHAYHDRVLTRGFANPAVLRAFEQAKQAGRYTRVERWHGPSRPTTFEPAYALTNAMEYFAEGTEAFFARNDFAPFSRAELREHDPALHGLLAQLWGVAAATPLPFASDAAVSAVARGIDDADGAGAASALGGGLLAVLFAFAVRRRVSPR